MTLNSPRCLRLGSVGLGSDPSLSDPKVLALVQPASETAPVILTSGTHPPVWSLPHPRELNV